MPFQSLLLRNKDFGPSNIKWQSIWVAFSDSLVISNESVVVWTIGIRHYDNLNYLNFYVIR